jgi:hypothetical protein
MPKQFLVQDSPPGCKNQKSVKKLMFLVKHVAGWSSKTAVEAATWSITRGAFGFPPIKSTWLTQWVAETALPLQLYWASFGGKVGSQINSGLGGRQYCSAYEHAVRYICHTRGSFPCGVQSGDSSAVAIAISFLCGEGKFKR